MGSPTHIHAGARNANSPAEPPASAEVQAPVNAVTRRSLTVIIPAFNEAQRIQSTLESTCQFLEQENYAWEILVINDGSSDATTAVVETFAQKTNLSNSVRVISLPMNQGKGAAVRTGILNARKQHCLICDADLAVPMADINRLWPALDANGDALVIGSRKVPGIGTIIQSKWYREFIGRIFNAMVARMAPNIHDTQCGFKLMPATMAKKLALTQAEFGFAFDVEYIHLALRSAWKVVEISVNWNHIEGSKVRIVRDSARMFVSIVKIWFRSKIGAYGPFPLDPPIELDATQKA